MLSENGTDVLVGDLYLYRLSRWVDESYFIVLAVRRMSWWSQDIRLTITAYSLAEGIIRDIDFWSEVKYTLISRAE